MKKQIIFTFLLTIFFSLNTFSQVDDITPKVHTNLGDLGSIVASGKNILYHSYYFAQLSTDDGDNWMEIPIPINHRIEASFIKDSLIIFLFEYKDKENRDVRDLHKSSDLGKTWKIINNYPRKFWGIKAIKTVFILKIIITFLKPLIHLRQ